MEPRGIATVGPVVHRQRLLSALAEVTRCKLALITAPGGYGKSTLIHDLARSMPGAAFSWLSLDPADSSLPIFLQQLARAVAHHLPQGGLYALTLETGPTDLAEVRHLGRLTAEVLGQHAEERLVIVLDDLHHVMESAQVLTFLEALLGSLPETVHLVIASRLKPPLPLARYQARGELIQVRAAELSFTAEEAAQLLAEQLGRRPPPAIIGLLMEQTEGWVTALLLLGNLLRVVPDGAWSELLRRFPAEGALFDFLAEEVLAHQPPHLQEFLLDTSVLGLLQPFLIERLFGVKGAGALLRELEARHLFLVPLPDRPGTYRYHHLFHAFLRRQLEARKGEGEVQRLHREAAGVYEGLGDLPEAVEHYLAAGAYDRAGLLMAEQVDLALKSLRREMIRAWLRRVPPELHDLDPNLIYVRAQLAGWDAQADVLPALYRRCLDLYEQQGDYRGMTRTLSWALNRYWRLKEPYFQEAPARWASHPDPEVRTYGRMLLAMGGTARGQWAEAFAELERILAEIPPATRAHFDCLETLSLVAFWMADARSVKRYGIPHILGRTALGDFSWGIYTWICFPFLADAVGLDQWQRQYMALEVPPAMSRMHQLVGAMGQGMVHLVHRRWEAALNAFESLLPYLGDNQAGYRAMGSDATFIVRQEMAGLYLRFGRVEEARRCLVQNLELAGTYPELGVMAYVGMAIFLAQQGDVAGARSHLSRGLAADPPGIEGLTTIALAVAAFQVALAEGERESARRRAAEAILLVRKRGCAWYLLHLGGAELLPLLVELARETLPGGLPGQVVFEVFSLLGDQAGPCLGPYLGHSDPEVRSAAFTLLDQIEHGRAPQQVPVLRIYTMGPLRAFRNDRPVDSADWNRTKVRLLLVLLLLRRGRPIAKESVMEMLWPHASAATARTNLRVTLHGLRKALEPDLEPGSPSAFLRADRESITLGGLEQIWTDLWEFEELLARARVAHRGHRIQEWIQLLQAACDLGRGAFLPEAAFVEHFHDVRTRVEQEYLGACLEVARYRLEAGEEGAAIQAARRALAVDRASEDGYQILIRAYLAMGDRQRALQAYKLCQKQIRRLLGSEPSPELNALLDA